jgi:hypothetical protein
MPHLPPARHETSKRDSPNKTKIKEKQNKTIPDSNLNLNKSMTHHNQTKELTSLIFLEHNYIAASHLKWLLVCFERLSGMKINYHKNDLTPINLDGEEGQNYSRIFCCNVGTFPFKYIGVPLHYEMLSKEDIHPLVDKIVKKIA